MMVYFSLRESKQNKKGLSPIEVSISTNGKRIYFSTDKYTVQQKPPSHYHIHKKEAELNVFRPLHLFCLIKILIPQPYQQVFQCPHW